MKPIIKFRAVTPDDHAEFTAQTHYFPTAMFGGIVAYTDKGIMGVVGLDSWTPTTVMAHWYIKNPRCIMPLWNEVTHYLAIHGRRKIIGSTPGDNVRALRMIFGKLGFVEIARIKDGWGDGVDIVISEYLINVNEQQVAA